MVCRSYAHKIWWTNKHIWSTFWWGAAISLLVLVNYAFGPYDIVFFWFAEVVHIRFDEQISIHALLSDESCCKSISFSKIGFLSYDLSVFFQYDPKKLCFSYFTLP